MLNVFNFIRPILEASTRSHPDCALFCVALALGYQRAGDLPRAKERGSLRDLYYQATVIRDPSPGPADRVRPRLRLYGAGRHGTGTEAFPSGPGDGGTLGAARPSQERALEDCVLRTQGQGAEEGRRSSI